MLNFEPGDRIELVYDDGPAAAVRATVERILTDRDEGMGIEVQDYTSYWIEIRVDEPGEVDATAAVLFGTDFRYRLDGRLVTIRKREEARS